MAEKGFGIFLDGEQVNWPRVGNKLETFRKDRSLGVRQRQIGWNGKNDKYIAFVSSTSGIRRNRTGIEEFNQFRRLNMFKKRIKFAI